jgi:Protein of unknown function (DUF3570)
MNKNSSNEWLARRAIRFGLMLVNTQLEKSGTQSGPHCRVSIPRSRFIPSSASAAVPFAVSIFLLSPPSTARAEDSVAYKYENYTEAGGRVGVRTQGVTANEEIGVDTQVGLTAVTDAIAGATPTGLPAPVGSNEVPVAHLSDHRKSWEVDLAHQFERINLSAGMSQSREHDYLSRGWSLNSLTDFNEKNTTMLVGVAGHDDSVETFYDPQHLYVEKHSFSAIAGLTQLLDPTTTVTLNITWGRETGYLSDQYKLVEQSVELFPGAFFPLVFAENRPSEHNFGVVFASIDKAVPRLNGALEATYRFYQDTYGVAASTFELRWLQKIGTQFVVAPDLRLYRQGAANFYYYDLRSTGIVPSTIPIPSGPAYSSDYRLSSLTTITCGIKATFKASERLQFDLAYDRYAMRGLDGVTPQSAYPKANIVTVGAKISW